MEQRRRYRIDPQAQVAVPCRVGHLTQWLARGAGPVGVPRVTIGRVPGNSLARVPGQPPGGAAAPKLVLIGPSLWASGGAFSMLLGRVMWPRVPGVQNPVKTSEAITSSNFMKLCVTSSSLT